MLKKKVLRDIFAKLYLIRKVENLISEIYSSDKIKSPVHLSIGQEAIAVGICKNLKKEDFVSNTYRAHATFLAKGGSLKSFFSELYGKENGCAGGRGGSMHLIDIKNGIIGSSAVVGTTIPISAGYALKEKIKKSKNIIVCFFGDGATEEGCFYETLNFSALKRLPILFVCENNSLAINTSIKERWSKNNLDKKSESFGIQSVKLKDNDVIKIFKKTKKIINYVRNNQKPFLLEIECVRECEHVGPTLDTKKLYIDKIYTKKFNKDLFRNYEFKKLSVYEKEKIKFECDKKINNAIKYAEASNFPNLKSIKNFLY